MKIPPTIDGDYHRQYSNELNPLYLNYISTLTGHYPIPLESGFSYCEVGCGEGVTLNGLAELFPKGQFMGIDNDSSYISGASAMAEGVGCSNIDFKCLNFNELSKAELSDFDFIILHDIYSWVDKDTRHALKKFIASHLKEEGVLYLSYQAMPGGSAIAPLRDIISFHTSGIASDNLIKAQSGLDYLEFMQSNKAGYFIENIAANQFFNNIRTKDISYVANRILNNNFQPYFFHQIVQEMGKLGLSFSGSAICHLNFIDLAVPLEFQEFLKTVTTREQFETHGDLIRNQRFRKDIFIKSDKVMSEQEQVKILSEIVFGTTCLEKEFELMAVFGDVELSYTGDVFKRLISVLSNTPKSPVDLLASEQLKDLSLEVIIDALKFLVSGGQILPFIRSSDHKVVLDIHADRYSIATSSNIEFLKNRLFKQDKITLLAPNAGIGVQLTMAEALFALCTAEASRDEVIYWVLQRLIEADQEILTDGANSRDTIASGIKEFRKKCLPNLLRLGILIPVEN